MKKLLMVLVAIAIIAAPATLAGEKPAKPVSNADIAKMTAKYRSKGWVGLELDKSELGPVVTRVVEGSPAVAAGFQKGDVLLAVNGFKYANKHKAKEKMSADQKAKLKAVKAAFKPGNEVVYVVLRDGEKVKLKVRLASPPDTVIAQWIGEHLMREAEVEAVAKR